MDKESRLAETGNPEPRTWAERRGVVICAAGGAAIVGILAWGAGGHVSSIWFAIYIAGLVFAMWGMLRHQELKWLRARSRGEGGGAWDVMAGEQKVGGIDDATLARLQLSVRQDGALYLETISVPARLILMHLGLMALYAPALVLWGLVAAAMVEPGYIGTALALLRDVPPAEISAGFRDSVGVGVLVVVLLTMVNLARQGWMPPVITALADRVRSQCGLDGTVQRITVCRRRSNGRYVVAW